MNHWKETADILSRLAELAAAGRPAALATVVEIVGSAYPRAGAQPLHGERGGTLGSVSGGCLEADVREVAAEVMATGKPSLRHYNTGGEDIVFGLGLGCNGLVDVFVQPATAGPFAALADRLRELLAGDSPLALATVIDGDDLGAVLAIGQGGPTGTVQGSLGSPELDRRTVDRARGLLPPGRSGVHDDAGRRVFVELLSPPTPLGLCGAGDDARPL